VASVTIRRLPDELVARIKAAAAAHGHSLEQELRDTLAARYATRQEILDTVRQRWEHLPEVSAAEIDAWVDTGRE
jgi:plasmid stability protein